MTTMTADKAKDYLDELLDKAAEGEQVEIVRDDGSAFILIRSYRQLPGGRRGLVGSLEGKIWMADDFDDIPEGFEPYLPDVPEKED